MTNTYHLGDHSPPRPDPPWSHPPPAPTAMTDVSKSMSRDQQLAATLDAIEDTDPTDIQVYTDGSTHEDYFRAIFLFASCYYMTTDYIRASLFYMLSGFLDALDGYFARILNQGSRFGATLDMLIDRISTMCLCAALCHFYPQYLLFLQIAMALDIFSHWLHLHVTSISGKASHKTLDRASNPILQLYYGNKVVLFTTSAANELFFCMLYILKFTAGPVLPLVPGSVGVFKLILCLSAPIAFIKNCISVLQLCVAAQSMARIDVEERSGVNSKTE